MKTLIFLTMLANISCGSICEREDSCSKTESEKEETKTEAVVQEDEEKTSDQWEVYLIGDEKTKCLTTDYSTDYDTMRFCACKIEIVSQSWPYESWKRHPFTISRGLEDSEVMDQCVDWAERNQEELPEVPEEVKEEIDTEIAEKESEGIEDEDLLTAIGE